MNMRDSWVTAADAARILGVSRATLYAYVSRGYIRSQAAPGTSRARRYSREDVERTRRRSEERRDPRKVAARALDWGTPVLESSITLIDGHSVYYRGHDAVTLAESRSVAEVASLMWTGRFDTVFPTGSPSRPAQIAAIRDGRQFIGRAQCGLAEAATQDDMAFDLRPDRVARTGWRILQIVTRTSAPTGDAAATIDVALAGQWRVPARSIDLLRHALILCADHELNVSSFTARCVASAGSHPYAVVIAGLAALEGTRHAGVGARVEAMLASMRHARHLRTALAQRLRRGEPVDGFGHPLYANGDPRAAALLALLRHRYSRSPELEFVLEFLDAAESLLREQPNIDFALTALSRVLRLPSGSPLTLFAIGRTIGWIGHAIEQYRSGQLIRPRAQYVGTLPPAAASV